MDTPFNKYSNIHFIGIAGSGMSALAHIIKSYGISITGSDIEESPHKAENIDNDVDLVIYSPAIPETNIEIQTAKQKKIKTISYPEALGLLTKSFDTIAVCGTHGKTTTTGMIAAALIANNLDPTVLVGANIAELDNLNCRVGKSNILLIEACEYKRAFLNYHPKYIVLTNIEADHLDYYKDEQDYKNAFTEFINKLPEDGILVSNSNANNAVSFNLSIPGEHNIQNAKLAYALTMQFNADPQATINALNSFKGASRRFEIKGTIGKTTIIDDYAHHPTAIRATLKATREKYGADKNILCVFQPHQYNRTHKLLKDFSTSFADADAVIIPNIYKVRDTIEDQNKISPQKLVEAISNNHPNAIYGNGLRETEQKIKKSLNEYDIVITMGAGDVWKVSESLTN